MRMKLLISRLASPETRAAASRALAVVCGVGFLLTLLVLGAAGAGFRQWFFVLLLWTLFVYAPLRILLEAAQTLAPALRRRLAAGTAEDARRYDSPAGIELAVDRLLVEEIVMPRIATPLQSAKARDGAIAVLAQQAKPGTARDVTDVALASVERWVTHLGPWASREAGQNIQARWSEVRALAALAAMTRILVAARADRAGGLGDEGAARFLDACLDYCDELALEVDVPRWDEPSLGLALEEESVESITRSWKAYCETASPALDARARLLHALFSAGPPARSTVS